MLDPDANLGRRAWVACPRCPEDDCPTCQRGASCERHWRYLLGTEAHWVFLQCPFCLYRWWHDTQFGLGHQKSA